MSLIISVYFLNTGCLLYPVSFTCFDNFAWSIGTEETIKMSDHYKLWSKAGKAPNFVVDNPNLYLKDFNWIPNWIDMYFFNKVSDFLIGLVILCFTFFAIFRQKSNSSKRARRNIRNSSYLYIIFIFLFILLLEWFFNHPSLRYGGYILISLAIFIPFSIYLERQGNLYDKIKPKLKFIILLTIIIFISRNGLRINDEIKKYDYKPIKETFYFIDQNHFRVTKLFEEIIKNYNNCQEEKKVCNYDLSKKIIQVFTNRYIFLND